MFTYQLKLTDLTRTIADAEEYDRATLLGVLLLEMTDTELKAALLENAYILDKLTRAMLAT